MTSDFTSRLKLHVEEQIEPPPALPEADIAPLAAAFERATGWELRVEQTPCAPGDVWSTTIDGGETRERLVLSSPRKEAKTGKDVADVAIDFPQARGLALAIGSLLSEMNQLRRAVWQREAELAAGVPVTTCPDEPHLAERLEAVLKAGAEAVGCPAAGLYLLDEATRELKLRAAYGLARERLLEPARPLRGAVADLEALVGHAVVLEDTALLPHWRCPEDFPSAVCVPVSSPSIPLGTLWVFSDKPRDFTPQETNLLEIIAGRLAADLEREMLLAAGNESKKREKQFAIAAQWQHDRLPSIVPLLDGYEVAGWTEQAGEIGGDFFDWSVLADGRVALLVGDADGGPLESALSAAALHAATKSHANYRHGAGELLTRVNESIIAASPGDQRASLAYALLEPETGGVALALAGRMGAIVVGADNRVVTTTDSPRLGENSEASYCEDAVTLQPGEVLVLISSGVRQAVDGAGLRIGEAAIGSLIAQHLCDSAESLITRVRRLLEHGQQIDEDMTVLVVKRRS